MKSFKKVMAGMLMGIMVIGMLTGCGGDPVADDFEKFLNTDMVDVNACLLYTSPSPRDCS